MKSHRETVWAIGVFVFVAITAYIARMGGATKHAPLVPPSPSPHVAGATLPDDIRHTAGLSIGGVQPGTDQKEALRRQSLMSKIDARLSPSGLVYLGKPYVVGVYGRALMMDGEVVWTPNDPVERLFEKFGTPDKLTGNPNRDPSYMWYIPQQKFYLLVWRLNERRGNEYVPTKSWEISLTEYALTH